MDYVFAQNLHHEQDVTQGQFSRGLKVDFLSYHFTYKWVGQEMDSGFSLGIGIM